MFAVFLHAVTEDIPLKAKYKINSYKISFSKNGAAQSSGSMKDLWCTYGADECGEGEKVPVEGAN